MTPPGAASQQPNLALLREAVADILGVSATEITDDANLLQSGLDSIGIARLVSRLRRDGIRVSTRELIAEPTVASLRRRLDTVPGPGTDNARPAGPAD